MTVYGRGKGGNFNPFDLLLAAAGRVGRITLPWSERQRFWLVHVEDAAEVFAELALAEAVSQPIYNSLSERLTMGALAEAIGPVFALDIGFEEPGRRVDQVAGLDDRRLREEFPALGMRSVSEWARIELARRDGGAAAAPSTVVVRTDSWNGYPGASASGYVLAPPPDEPPRPK